MIALSLAPLASASSAEGESRGLFCATPTACELQIYVENDILGGTDRYYTGGIKVGGAVGAEGIVERIFNAPAEHVLRRITDDPRAVARNIFLDGNVFRSSPSVDRRDFVYDLKVGFSVRIASARLSLTHTWRSEEFTTPVRGGGNQRFQSLNLSWQF